MQTIYELQQIASLMNERAKTDIKTPRATRRDRRRLQRELARQASVEAVGVDIVCSLNKKAG